MKPTRSLPALLFVALMFCFASCLAAAEPEKQPAAKDGATATTPAEKPAAEKKNGPRTLGIVLYNRFELLDVYGPAEMFGNLPGKVKVVMIAQQAGPVTSSQGPQVVAQYGFDDCPPLDLLLVPGGFGTMTELKNEKLLDFMRARAATAEITMSVCSGSALLAKAGLLDGRKATSNKRYFQLAVAEGPKTEWIREARWVDDGNRVTSSGVSAGTDMALAVIARLWGQKVADDLADNTEYQWHRDPTVDPFALPAKSTPAK